MVSLPSPLLSSLLLNPSFSIPYFIFSSRHSFSSFSMSMRQRPHKRSLSVFVQNFEKGHQYRIGFSIRTPHPATLAFSLRSNDRTRVLGFAIAEISNSTTWQSLTVECEETERSGWLAITTTQSATFSLHQLSLTPVETYKARCDALLLYSWSLAPLCFLTFRVCWGGAAGTRLPERLGGAAGSSSPGLPSLPRSALCAHLACAYLVCAYVAWVAEDIHSCR